MPHHLQDYIDKMNDAASAARAGYHLTLGELRDALEEADPELRVVFVSGQGAGPFHSYRGYYTDLAIRTGPSDTVLAWRERVAIALERTFVGYKGGEYPASPGKPLWRSEVGEASGMAIIAAEIEEARFVLVTKQVE